jgi:hypothetical protein
MSLRLEVKQVGRKKAIASRELPLGDLASNPTLRDLIERIVTLEVSAFRERQRDGLLIRALTEVQIQEQRETGKIAMGGLEDAQEVQTDDAVKVALQAFEDGLYYVFMNDEQIESLEQPVNLSTQSKIMFLRLVALAGG